MPTGWSAAEAWRCHPPQLLPRTHHAGGPALLSSLAVVTVKGRKLFLLRPRRAAALAAGPLSLSYLPSALCAPPPRPLMCRH